MVIDGREDVDRLEVDRLGVVDRREEDAAAGERQVPVAFDEQVAAGGPDVVRRDPDPVGLDGRPEAGPPEVAAPLPVPAPGRPEDLARRGGAVRTRFEAGGRRGKVGRLALARLNRPPVRRLPPGTGTQAPGTHWKPPSTWCQ